jgi:hypothetical protein
MEMMVAERRFASPLQEAVARANGPRTVTINSSEKMDGYPRPNWPANWIPSHWTSSPSASYWGCDAAEWALLSMERLGTGPDRSLDKFKRLRRPYEKNKYTDKDMRVELGHAQGMLEPGFVVTFEEDEWWAGSYFCTVWVLVMRTAEQAAADDTREEEERKKESLLRRAAVHTRALLARL